MLLRLIVKNFRSFREPVQFDMFPNTKRTTLHEHIHHELKTPLLKQAAIYGPNGSGKSSFVAALQLLKKLALSLQELSSEEVYCSQHHLWNDEQQRPVVLMVEFSSNNNYYIYSVELSPDAITREALYESGIGEKKNALIFERKREKVYIPEGLHGEMHTILENILTKQPLRTLIALNREFGLVPLPALENTARWFEEKLEIVGVHAVIPTLIDLLYENSELKQFTDNAFQKIGLGMKNMEVRSRPVEEWIEKHRATHPSLIDRRPKREGISVQRNTPLLSLKEEEGVRKVRELVFHHIGQEGAVGELNIEAESDGTIRLLSLMPAIYKAIHGATVVIDEVENSIHPQLVYRLLLYYAQEKSRGQLIFTTHQTMLLDQQSLMRPDEVWIAEKIKGQTQMYSLNEFKIHSTLSMEKGYLEGRYGGLPDIGDIGENS